MWGRWPEPEVTFHMFIATFFSMLSLHLNGLSIHTYCLEGGEIAQALASLSTKRAIRVRARLDRLVLER